MTAHTGPTGGEIPAAQVVQFTGDLPSQIANLKSLMIDFRSARDWARQHLSKRKFEERKASKKGNEQFAATNLEALWCAAAIAYRRPFAKGTGFLAPQSRRNKVLSDWRDLLTPEQKTAHDKIFELTSQHVAHRNAGDLHQMQVIAYLHPDGKTGVAGMGIVASNQTGPGPEIMQQLIDLCEFLIEIVEKRCHELCDIFENEINEYDKDELYSAFHAGHSIKICSREG
jgi:hypothetical protein